MEIFSVKYKNQLDMAEYSWTIQVGPWRIGWIKYKYWNSFFDCRFKGYKRIGHLDFYNEIIFD